MKKFNFKFGLIGWLLIITVTAFAAKIGDNILRIGDPIGFDITINMGSGAIRWNSTDSKLQFSNDGVSFKDIGSGGGGGGGEGFNNGFGPDDNGDAENGLVGWSETGGGTFEVSLVDPLQLLGSFEFTSSAQNDYVENANLSFDKDIFKGRSCQAQIEYIGGDENLTMKLMDGNDLVVASLVLPAHTISAPESIFFLCPNAAQILADANVGNLRIRIDNVGASAAPLIRFDKAYIGTLIGLSETTLPDVFSFIVHTNTGVVLAESGGVLTSCSTISTGRTSCSFQGLTEIPALTCTALVDDWNVSFNSLSPSSADIQIRNSAAVAADNNISCVGKKQGVDAKQTAQVYKSIPKVSENVNEFSAKVAIAGTVTDENVDIINGNCTHPGTGIWTCPAVGLTVKPNCVASRNSGVGNASFDPKYDATASSPTSLRFVATNESGVEIDVPFTFKCQKQGVDFKMPTVQPAIVGQVVNSYAESASKNVRVESCSITNAGTPTTGTPMCDSWVDSITDVAPGVSGINYDTSTFGGAKPTCTCTGLGNSGDCRVAIISDILLQINTYDASTTLTDMNLEVICTGAR